MGKEYTPAQAAAAKRYKSRFATIAVRVTQDEKTIIEGYAAARGLSASQYVKECALSAGTIPAYIDTPNAANKPQPPADLIATKDRNNLVMWLLDHGWNNAETMQFISDNGL